MEVIGAVSSVVALVETTSKLAKGLARLAQRWHNAPDEIEALARATQTLAAKFAYVEDTITNSPTTLVDGITRHGLMQLVAKANAANAELVTLQARLEAYDTIFQRAKWAVKDAKTAKTVLALVKDTEEGLSMWISFISLKGHSLTLQQALETQQILTVGFAEMKQMFSTMAVQPLLPEPSLASPSFSPASSVPTSVLTARTQATVAARRVFGGIAWEASSSWQSWGLVSRVIKSTKGQSTDYNVAIRLDLPMAWWFGSHVFKGEVTACFPRQNTLTLRHPSYFAVARVLDDSHPFVEACRDNDVATVRRMLGNGEARPTDEDEHGFGPLMWALLYDSSAVVNELLDNGTDVDASIDSSNGTALHMATQRRNLDAIRLLLHRGASPDHHNAHGCDAYYSCNLVAWKKNQEVPAREIYDILGEYTVPDLEVAKFWSSTVLQVAAERVRDEDIDALVALGADVDAIDRLGTPALYHAVQYGNASAYFALLKQGASCSSPSCSAENLLFVALRGKAYEDYEYQFLTPDFEAISRHLLRCRNVHLGVKLYIPTGSSRYPESVAGYLVTFKQLAEAYGPETEAWFMGLVQGECCPLNANKDERKALALRLELCVVQGCKSCKDWDYFQRDEFEEGAGRILDDVDDGDESFSSDEASDEGQKDLFWDAEEAL